MFGKIKENSIFRECLPILDTLRKSLLKALASFSLVILIFNEFEQGLISLIKAFVCFIKYLFVEFHELEKGPISLI